MMSQLLLFEVLVLATLFQASHSSTWFKTPQQLRVSDSVRIRASPSVSDVKYGPGSDSDAVGLRSIEHHLKPKQPYEWFLKFNLASLAGKHITSATLSVTKCAASINCKSRCSLSGKCSCATVMGLSEPSCGGGNIDDAYDGSGNNDDLHVWHVPSAWDNHWKYSHWRQTFDGGTRNGVEKCCDKGTGGSSKFSYSHYLSGTQTVGKTGTTDLNVVNAIGKVDPTVEGTRYKVTGGYVSLRLTVNGSKTRFFVPEGGDFNYIPVLKLGLEYTTTTTSTTSTSTTTTSTTTTDPNATYTTVTPSTTTTSRSTTTNTTTATIATTTVAASTLTATNTTTLTTTGNTTTITVTRSTASAAAAVIMSVEITQIFMLQFGRTEDLAAAVGRKSFGSSCRAAAAHATGRNITEIKVISLGLSGARRLAGLTNAAATSSVGSNIMLRYRIDVNTSAAINATLAIAQSSEFARTFGQRLISEEQALTKGLRISRFFFVRTSVATSGSQPRANRTSLGGVLDIFGRPDWDNAELQSWAASAVPAIRAALVKELSTVAPAIPSSDLVVSIALGPTELTATYAKVEFQIFALVPAMKQTAADPGGKLTMEHIQSYVTRIAALSKSTAFSGNVSAELASRQLPELPGMAFTLEGSSEPIASSSSSANGVVIALAVIALVVLAGVCFCGVQLRRKPDFRRSTQRLCSRLCPCCCRQQTPHIENTDKIEEIVVDYEVTQVKPFYDDAIYCTCGEVVGPDEEFCGCGQTIGEILRERYVKAKTIQTMADLVAAFDEPAQPDTAWKKLGGARNILKQVEARSSRFSNLGEDFHAARRKHKSSYLGNDRKSVKRDENRHEASALRHAMGGNATEKSPTDLRRSLPGRLSSSGRPSSAGSHSNDEPAQSSSEDELEVVEVTDSSSDDGIPEVPAWLQK